MRVHKEKFVGNDVLRPRSFIETLILSSDNPVMKERSSTTPNSFAKPRLVEHIIFSKRNHGRFTLTGLLSVSGGIRFGIRVLRALYPDKIQETIPKVK